MKPGLRVLITNNTLANRAGSEIYARDVAMSLLTRGHSPVAYSTVLGDVAEDLRCATVPVIDDMSSMTVAPDVIHGHHHLETMTALLHFPGVPAVYFCHGWLPWEEAPPRFPRILRYVAVDELCRERLIVEHGIDQHRVRLLLNFVDLRRFRPRTPLPSRPARALIFSNEASEQNYAALVRAACECANIRLDVVGLRSGNVVTNPESLLGDYDLVFAKARSALESLAVGAAVVLCDLGGIGPMVKSHNLERLRSLNFGVRTLRDPVCAELISSRIAEYDSNDAALVSSRIRETAGAETAIELIEALYREAIDEYASTAACDAGAEARAAADYMRWLSPRLKDQTRAARDWLASELLNLPSRANSAEPKGRTNLVLTAYRRLLRRLGDRRKAGSN